MRLKLRNVTVGMAGRALLSRAGWLIWALLAPLLYGLFHALGWREDTAILSGASSDGGARIRGLLYIAAHFGSTLLSPILVLSALIYGALDWHQRGRNLRLPSGRSED